MERIGRNSSAYSRVHHDFILQFLQVMVDRPYHLLQTVYEGTMVIMMIPVAVVIFSSLYWWGRCNEVSDFSVYVFDMNHFQFRVMKVTFRPLKSVENRLKLRMINNSLCFGIRLILSLESDMKKSCVYIWVTDKVTETISLDKKCS